MQSLRIDWRSVRLAIAVIVLASLAVLGAVAMANARSPEVLPVEPDGGIGGAVVLPVEPDGGIGDTPEILPVEVDGGIGN